ncbi:hypothetical protein GI374_12150 [Paracoccus sp. S-4012]|uniref:hypothetical protein n=1 Tax=Paracoccus sp. S-4012 TaxID=2665648 RepID=UPI0012AF103D|nr:hypothetical protein [Paracoccus sp. S-4012]MRX51187.1 hypothetical protein [Paracoccus sp. S-4012]
MSRVTTAALVGQLAGGLDIARAGRFRRVVRLTLPTGGADGAVVAAAPVLDVTFLAREVEATAASAPEPASLAPGGGGLVLTLPVAREIARVRLTAPQPGDQVAAFRFDGAAVSDDPVAVAAHGGSGAALEVTDQALILRRRNAGDHALSAGAIAGVVLRYPPVNPRLALMLVGDPAGEQGFPPAAGPGGVPVFPGVIQAGAQLAARLDPALARLAEAGPLPEALALDLILEADQPCAARIDALDLGLRLERVGFAGEAGKRVLRFGGQGTQAVELALPPAAAAVEGRMGVSLSAPPSAGVPAVSTASGPAAGADGVALGPGNLVAGRIDLPAAAVIVGAEAVLAAAEPQTLIAARLMAERNGRPDVVIAVSDEVGLGRARPAPVSFAFPPTVAPAGPLWLAVEARRGAAVAMLGGGGAVVKGGALVTEAGLAVALRFAALAGEPEATGIVLRLNGLALPLDGGTVDLTPALAALPEPHPAAVTLSVRAAGRAVVTLDPPRIRYSLP